MANEQTVIPWTPTQPAKERKPRRPGALKPSQVQPGLVCRYIKRGTGPGHAKGQVVVVTDVTPRGGGLVPEVVVYGRVLPTLGPPLGTRKHISCQLASLARNYESVTGFNYQELGLDIQDLAPIAERLQVTIAYTDAHVYPVLDDQQQCGEALRQWAGAAQVTTPQADTQLAPGQLEPRLVIILDKILTRLELVELATTKLAELVERHPKPKAVLDTVNLFQSTLNGMNARLGHIEAHPTRMLDGGEMGKLAADLAIDLLELPDSFLEPLADRMAATMMDAIAAKLVAHVNRVLFTENFTKLLAEHLAAAKREPVNADAAAGTRGRAYRGESKHG